MNITGPSFAVLCNLIICLDTKREREAKPSSQKSIAAVAAVDAVGVMSAPYTDVDDSCDTVHLR